MLGILLIFFYRTLIHNGPLRVTEQLIISRNLYSFSPRERSRFVENKISCQVTEKPQCNNALAIRHETNIYTCPHENKYPRNIYMCIQTNEYYCNRQHTYYSYTWQEIQKQKPDMPARIFMHGFTKLLQLYIISSFLTYIVAYIFFSLSYLFLSSFIFVPNDLIILNN